jgi:hypothetical protein
MVNKNVENSPNSVLYRDLENNKWLDKRNGKIYCSVLWEKEVYMPEVQTILNSVISRVNKTTQIAQPPTRIHSIAKVHPVRKFGSGFKPLPNYNKVSSLPLRMGHLSNWVKVSRDTSGKITVAFPYNPSRIMTSARFRNF